MYFYIIYIDVYIFIYFIYYIVYMFIMYILKDMCIYIYIYYLCLSSFAGTSWMIDHWLAFLAVKGKVLFSYPHLQIISHFLGCDHPVLIIQVKDL